MTVVAGWVPARAGDAPEGGKDGSAPLLRGVHFSARHMRPLQTAGLLTERTRRTLWQARHGQPRHVAVREPGELVCLDTFYIGQLKGVGKTKAEERQRRRGEKRQFTRRCFWRVGSSVDSKRAHTQRSLVQIRPAQSPIPHPSRGEKRQVTVSVTIMLLSEMPWEASCRGPTSPPRDLCPALR